MRWRHAASALSQSDARENKMKKNGHGPEETIGQSQAPQRTPALRAGARVTLHSLMYNVTGGGIVHSNENVTGGTMPTDEQMTLDERLEYLRKMKKRYDTAEYAERAHLLDEMEHVTELRRKSLIRLMRGDLERHPRTEQRGVT
jgi:hypothetical protein